jgi:hypothetical protein
MKRSHFPDFLPDETIYSVACRYFDRVQFCSHSFVSQYFFGSQTNGTLTDSPSSLERLSLTLPPHHRYTAVTAVDQHTPSLTTASNEAWFLGHALARKLR